MPLLEIKMLQFTHWTAARFFIHLSKKKVWSDDPRLSFWKIALNRPQEISLKVRKGSGHQRNHFIQPTSWNFPSFLGISYSYTMNKDVAFLHKLVWYICFFSGDLSCKKEQKTINITILVHVLTHLIQLKHSVDQRKYIDSLTKSHKFTISLCLVLSNELDLQQQWDYVTTLKILQIFNFTISSDQPLSYIPTFFITKKSREKKCKFST